MKRIFALPIYLISLVLLEAAPAKTDEVETFTLETRQGKKYEQAQILGYEVDGIRLMYREGVARVAYADMTEAQRKKFGQSQALEKKPAVVNEGPNAEPVEPSPKSVRESSEDQAAAGFRVFRTRILESIKSMDFDYAEQDALLLKWIGIYEEYGRKEWADILRGDRTLLREKEVQRTKIEAGRKPAELDAQTARLQQQIDSLRAAATYSRTQLQTSSSLQGASLHQTTTYRTYPNYSYYPRYSYSYPSYYYRPPVYIQPSVYYHSSYCPPRSSTSYQTPAASYRGGTLNANMNSRGAGN